MTQIINLFGGPGVGKSTHAAELFVWAKYAGVGTVELVREYAKKWAWTGRNHTPYSQIYVTGQQIEAESHLLGKVDWIITDAPVLMGSVYATEYSPFFVECAVKECVDNYLRQVREDGHTIHNILIDRKKPYVQAGRFEDEAQAKLIDRRIGSFLNTKRIGYTRTTDPLSIFQELANAPDCPRDPDSPSS